MQKLLPPQFLLICLLSMLLLNWLFPIASLIPVPYNWLGLLPMLAGFVLSGLASGHFNRLGTNIQTFGEPGQLVSDGWFRYTRNPMYLGFLIALVGAWICMGTLAPALGPLAFLLTANTWYIPFEERAMQAKFGPAYATYTQQVRRWL